MKKKIWKHGVEFIPAPPCCDGFFNAYLVFNLLQELAVKVCVKVGGIWRGVLLAVPTWRLACSRNPSSISALLVRYGVF